MAVTSILAFGDSLTAGFGVAPDRSFAARLEQRLLEKGYQVRVINGGVSGDTTSDGLRRLDGLLRQDPDLVLLELGPNDFLQWVPVQTVRENLERMIRNCLDRGCPVLLAGFQSLKGMDEDYTRSFHSVYPELAQAYGLALCPDFLPDIPYNPELTLPDGIHPNEAGIDRIVEHVLPCLEPLIVG